jgi:hypothetical protein
MQAWFHKEQRRREGECEEKEKDERKCGNAPHYFEKTELETIRPLLAHAEIRKDEEASVSVVIL